MSGANGKAIHIMKKSYLNQATLLIVLLAICNIVYDFGFNQNPASVTFINYLYLVFLLLLIISIPLNYLLRVKKQRKIRLWIADGIFWLFFNLFLVTINFNTLNFRFLDDSSTTKVILLLFYILFCFREIQDIQFSVKYRKMNPATILLLGFGMLIIAGTFLLMLPRATYSGISFTDSLFTSTSAVCVTGLVVVDTGSYFTPFGHSIILTLIQLGGLGIMTFTSFFAYFFMGGSSYQSLIVLGNLTNNNKIAEVFDTLKKVLIFTLLAEGIGFLLIFININSPQNNFSGDSLFFSLFHAVSAFCNAGFSTLENSLYDINFRYNYPLHLVIAALIIIGGLGFPVIINLYQWVKYIIKNRIMRINRRKEVLYKANVINLNTKLVVYTTLSLIIFGTLLFYILEYNNTLAEHSGIGKFIAAFFSSVTPRTAGFNTIDTSAINIPAMIIILLLMWVGASPGSTGGGIKTSTFALAFLNILSLARGKGKVELNLRQIPETSINRSFAFVFLSLCLIGLFIFLLVLTDSDKPLSAVVFEVFSAFSTVGLSRGITADLSVAGRYIIILAMFIGRVGALTFLSAIFVKVHLKLATYPKEEILIN